MNTMKIYLKNLNLYDKYIKILQMAGWYEGRMADIRNYEQEAYAGHIILTKAMKKFLYEYAELDSILYLGFESTNGAALYDFSFRITPSQPYLLLNTKEYREICSFAKEKTLCVGKMGYYYPAVCAVGESGKLYLKHDYADSVEVFDSIIDSIAFELRTNKDLVCVSDVQE